MTIVTLTWTEPCSLDGYHFRVEYHPRFGLKIDLEKDEKEEVE